MVNFNELRDRILSAIQSNGDQEITGDILQDQLIGIVNAVEEIAQGFSELDGKNERLQTAIDSQSEMIEDLQDMKIDKEADDYYPDLSVGTADNLSGEDEVDSEFSFRRSGGGAIADGVARVQSIKGNSVVWNNMVDTRGYEAGFLIREGIKILQGHKYLLQRSAANAGLYLIPIVDGSENYDMVLRDGEYAKIFVSQYTDTTDARVYAERYCGACVIADLTKMFGAGNEPTTIEDFYQRIPVGVNLYAYNSGVTINFFADGIKSVGRNLYDGEKARLIGGKTYYLNGRYKSLMFNGESLALPGNRLFTPSISGEIEAEGEGICINLSDSEFNGAYEEYIESIQDLTMLRKYFTNGMRGRGEACDKIRYNKSSHRWEIVRLGEIDMGTLNWFDDNFNGVPTFTSKDVTNGVLHDYEVIGGTLLEPYIEKPRFNELSKSDDQVFVFNSSAHAPNTLAVRDTRYSNAAAFKAAMSGVMLYYELSEPIVTPINEKFNLDYKVENGGTEEIISTSPSSAMRADIAYGFNAVGLIKQLRSMIEALSAKVANL